MGHNRGFQSTLSNNAVNGSTASNVWGADSFRRENSEHGPGLGAGQGAGHGAGQGVRHGVWHGGNNNVGQVRDSDRNKGQNNKNNNTSSQQRNREMEDVWGNIGNSAGSNQDR